jgi:hypothetical protein
VDNWLPRAAAVALVEDCSTSSSMQLFCMFGRAKATLHRCIAGIFCVRMHGLVILSEIIKSGPALGADLPGRIATHFKRAAL